MARTIIGTKDGKTIIVAIDDAGNPTVTTKGFAGADCLKAAAPLEAALGGTTNLTRTPEFFQTTNAGQKAR